MLNLTDLNWIFGIIGSIGLVAAIALAVFAPLAFAVLARVVGDVLKTRVGLAIFVGAACLYGGLVYGDLSGRGEERAICAAKQKVAEAEAVQRDKDQSQIAADDEQKSTAELKTDSIRDKEQVDALRTADQGCHPISADQLK